VARAGTRERTEEFIPLYERQYEVLEEGGELPARHRLRADANERIALVSPTDGELA
jgi:hypothetical protein